MNDTEKKLEKTIEAIAYTSTRVRVLELKLATLVDYCKRHEKEPLQISILQAIGRDGV